MAAYRPVLDETKLKQLKLKQNANEGCNSCASVAGLVLRFIAGFILLVITPLRRVRRRRRIFGGAFFWLGFRVGRAVKGGGRRRRGRRGADAGVRGVRVGSTGDGRGRRDGVDPGPGGGSLAVRLAGAVGLILGDGRRLDAARDALVLQLFQLHDRVTRRPAVAVALCLLVPGAGRPSRIDDVTAPADVTHVHGRPSSHRPVVGADSLAEVAEVPAVLRVVGHRTVRVRQLLLDALDRPGGNLEQRQRRPEVRRIQHEHAILPYNGNVQTQLRSDHE